jgi:hypothetical protein
MGRHGDCPRHQGKSENSMGYPMENRSALQQAMGYPQYAMRIMGRHGDYTCRHAKPDKFMGYPMENRGMLHQAVGRQIRYHNTYTVLMTPWEDLIVPPIDVLKY